MTLIKNSISKSKSSKYSFWAFSLLFSLFLILILVDDISSQDLSKPFDVKNSFKERKISIIVAGDIINHKSQIKAANISGTKKYDYSHWFRFISPILKSYDFSIGNLETTFGGEPYSGYPAFSAPDTLAWFLKEAGFNALVTANNHSSDRGAKGLNGTVKALNRYGFIHTGIFPDDATKELINPTYLEKNGLKIALLNYTYGTNNGAKNLLINKTDTVQMLMDINKAKSTGSDGILVFLHWGQEYARTPNQFQTKLAEFCLNNGVNAVIGSHPHVIQKAEIFKKPFSDMSANTLCVYSLGNLLSNQRWRYSDGGLMVGFDFVKREKSKSISVENVKYEPVWVHAYFNSGIKYYDLIPTNLFESDKIKFDISPSDLQKLKIFIQDTKAILGM